MTFPEATTLPTDRQGSGPGVPAVRFDRVSLAFDENVVLREVGA